MNPYNYLYYHYYLLFLKWREDDIPEWNAVFALSLFLGANIMILAYTLGHTPSEHIDAKLVGGGFGLLIILLNYTLYIRKDRYKSVAKHYSCRTKPEDKFGIVIAILCTIEGFAIPFIYTYTSGFGFK